MYDAHMSNETSTSASLLFRARPDLSLPEYVARLDQTLRGSFADVMQLSWLHDDVAVIDIDGSRILIGFWQADEASPEASSGCKAVLVLSVGPGPDWKSEGQLNGFTKPLCESIVESVVAYHPADQIEWREFQGIVTAEDFDMLVDMAMQVRPSEPEPEPAVEPQPEFQSEHLAAPEKIDGNEAQLADPGIDAGFRLEAELETDLQPGFLSKYLTEPEQSDDAEEPRAETSFAAEAEFPPVAEYETGLQSEYQADSEQDDWDEAPTAEAEIEPDLQAEFLSEYSADPEQYEGEEAQLAETGIDAEAEFETDPQPDYLSDDQTDPEQYDGGEAQLAETGFDPESEYVSEADVETDLQPDDQADYQADPEQYEDEQAQGDEEEAEAVRPSRPARTSRRRDGAPRKPRPVRNLMEQIAQRAEEAEAPEAAPTPNLPVVANDMPLVPAAQLEELERIRLALYPPEDQVEEKPRVEGMPLAQRLTVYAANTTLMLVALPVGAALMTYNVLGGEDAKTTARAMALTGAALGLSHSTVAHAIMSLIS